MVIEIKLIGANNKELNLFITPKKFEVINSTININNVSLRKYVDNLGYEDFKILDYYLHRESKIVN